MVQLGQYAEIQSWDWDADTRTKAQGFMTSLRNGGNILALVILVNGLDTVKGLIVKLHLGPARLSSHPVPSDVSIHTCDPL